MLSAYIRVNKSAQHIYSGSGSGVCYSVDLLFSNIFIRKYFHVTFKTIKITHLKYLSSFLIHFPLPNPTLHHIQVLFRFVCLFFDFSFLFFFFAKVSLSSHFSFPALSFFHFSFLAFTYTLVFNLFKNNCCYCCVVVFFPFLLLCFRVLFWCQSKSIGPTLAAYSLLL